MNPLSFGIGVTLALGGAKTAAMTENRLAEWFGAFITLIGLGTILAALTAPQ